MPPCQRKLADNAKFSWRKVQNQQPLSKKLPASSFWKSITFFCGSGNEPNVNCTSKYSCNMNSVTFENFLHFLLGLQKKYFTILWRNTFLFPQIIMLLSTKLQYLHSRLVSCESSWSPCDRDQSEHCKGRHHNLYVQSFHAFRNFPKFFINYDKCPNLYA